MDELCLKQLSFQYAGADRPAIHSIDAAIQAGELVLLCGPSGSGKSTLLRALKPEITPAGTLGGEILWRGSPLRAHEARELASGIGFLDQNPEDGIVCDSVWHEIAFGPESLGMDPDEIRRRTAETAMFFGLEPLFRRRLDELSTGEKQLVSLAARLVMRPRVLLLDEPFAALDPVQSERLLRTLLRIRAELGTTVIVSEHRHDALFSASDRVLFLENGTARAFERPAELAQTASGKAEQAIPSTARLFRAIGRPEAPLTPAEGKRILEEELAGHVVRRPEIPEAKRGEALVTLSDVGFQYEKGKPVLDGVDLRLSGGEIFALLGANGAGKSTLLELLVEARRPGWGRIRRKKGLRAALVPQSPELLFARETAAEELSEMRAASDASTFESRRDALVERFGLAELLDRHPMDLSGGQRQRLAICKVLLAEPELILLDEPTKGADEDDLQTLARELRALAERGRGVLVVSHDVEFCAEAADRCALLFSGQILAEQEVHGFFSENWFYTTPVGRMAGSLVPGAARFEEFAEALKGARNESLREARNAR